MSRLRVSRRTYTRRKNKTSRRKSNSTRHRTISQSKGSRGSKKQRTRKRVGGTKNSIIVHEYYSVPYLGSSAEIADKSKRKLKYRRNTYDSSDKQQMHSATPTYRGIMESVDEALYLLKNTQDSSKDVSPYTETISILNETQIAKPTSAQLKSAKNKENAANKIKADLEKQLVKLKQRVADISKQLELES